MASQAPSLRVRVSYSEADQLWYAEVENLQGCFAAGETEQEAYNNVVEAIGNHIIFRLENLAHPKPNTVSVHPAGDHVHEIPNPVPA